MGWLYWPDKKVPELLEMKDYWQRVFDILSAETWKAHEVIRRNERALERHAQMLDLIEKDIAIHAEIDIPYADDEGYP